MHKYRQTVNMRAKKKIKKIEIVVAKNIGMAISEQRRRAQTE